MPTQYLKSTYQDLLTVLNMSKDSGLFQVGEGLGQISADVIETTMDRVEKAMLSSIPIHYANIIRGKISSGEYLTSKQYGAATGETTFQLAFAPISTTKPPLFFKNLKSSAGKSWSRRTRADALAPSAYSLNAITGVVTLYTALTEGDVLLAEYHHEADGTAFESFRHLVLKASRIEFLKSLPNWQGDQQSLVQDQEEIDNILMGFGMGDIPRGIGEIDAIDFEIETIDDLSQAKKVPHLGGWKH